MKNKELAKKNCELILQRIRINKSDYFANEEILEKFLKIAQSACPHDKDDIEIANFSKWCENCGYVFYC